MKLVDLNWYNTLSKPFFTPPAWLFGPAWTFLYVLMAVSAFFVWRKRIIKKKVKEALKVFVIQLVLNLAWSPIFFGLHDIFLALLLILVLWCLILLTIREFYKIDKIASYLLWPYLVWVSFATILNFSVWYLNK